MLTQTLTQALTLILTQILTLIPTLALTQTLTQTEEKHYFASGIVKYKLSLYFQQLCDSCMNARAFSPSLRSSTNPNARMQERSKSVRTFIHESQRFRNKADGLYLTL